MEKNHAEFEGTIRRTPAIHMVLGRRRATFTVRVASVGAKYGYDYIDCMAQDQLAQEIHDRTKEFDRIWVSGHMVTNYNPVRRIKRVTLVVENWMRIWDAEG